MLSASRTSLQDRPAMDPESSMTKMVSKVDRKAYLSSALVMLEMLGAGEAPR